MQNDEIRQLSDRLDRLERQNRWLKWCLLLVPLLLVSVGAARARLDEEEVITKVLIIKDDNRNRIAMGVNDKGETFINVFDKDGNRVKALGEER